MDAPTHQRRPTVALVAHDGKKAELVEWARPRTATLSQCVLFATGTTGARLGGALGLEITALKSGPYGGDAQLGAMIAEGRLDALIFFIDPLTAQPHDVDVKALLRMAILYDTPLAVSASTASAVLRSIEV